MSLHETRQRPRAKGSGKTALKRNYVALPVDCETSFPRGGSARGT